jgi:hypothetical protein
VVQPEASGRLRSAGLPVQREGHEPMTSIPRPVEGEFVIVLDPTRRRDERDRVRYTAFWFDPKTPGEGGPPDHLRGQVFFADPDENARDLERCEDVKSVRVIGFRPDWY